MRNRDGKIRTALEDPLDSDEQNEVINEIKAKAIKQSLFWRNLLYYLFILSAVIFGYAAFYALFYDINLGYQFQFLLYYQFPLLQIHCVLSSVFFAFCARLIKVN